LYCHKQFDKQLLSYLGKIFIPYKYTLTVMTCSQLFDIKTTNDILLFNHVVRQDKQKSRN